GVVHPPADRGRESRLIPPGLALAPWPRPMKNPKPAEPVSGFFASGACAPAGVADQSEVSTCCSGSLCTGATGLRARPRGLGGAGGAYGVLEWVSTICM